MPKDFDRDPTSQRAARLALDREFTVAGAHFKLRSGVDLVKAPQIDRWRVMFAQLVDPDAPPVDDDDFLATFYATMEVMLEPEDVERFKETCGPGTADPITVEDAFELVFWSVGQVTGRPTRVSSPSAPGLTTPTTEPGPDASTSPSSTPVVEASTASA